MAWQYDQAGYAYSDSRLLYNDFAVIPAPPMTPSASGSGGGGGGGHGNSSRHKKEREKKRKEWQVKRDAIANAVKAAKAASQKAELAAVKRRQDLAAEIQAAAEQGRKGDREIADKISVLRFRAAFERKAEHDRQRKRAEGIAKLKRQADEERRQRIAAIRDELLRREAARVEAAIAEAERVRVEAARIKRMQMNDEELILLLADSL